MRILVVEDERKVARHLRETIAAQSAKKVLTPVRRFLISP
jgi:DNA-binding response OmpR family regulator